MATNTFKNAKARLTGASAVTLLTAPSGSNQYVLIGCTICNRTTNTIKANLWITDSLAGNTYIASAVEIPAGATLVAIGGDQKVALLPQDAVKVSCDTASGIDTILSYLEVTP